MFHQHEEFVVGFIIEVVRSLDAERYDDSSHHTNVALARERHGHEISHSTLKKENEYTESREGTSFPDRP
jgi:hypothetical protein